MHSTIQKSTENRLKINITPYGEFFFNIQDKILNIEDYIFEKYFTTEKLWDGLLQFSGNNRNIEGRCT